MSKPDGAAPGDGFGDGSPSLFLYDGSSASRLPSGSGAWREPRGPTLEVLSSLQ